jgi:hypothetical protein
MVLRSAQPIPMRDFGPHSFSISLAFLVFLFSLPITGLAQNSNSSSASSSSGHSSASAPSYSVSVPASHAPAGSGGTYSTGSTHSGGTAGTPHSGGNTQNPGDSHHSYTRSVNGGGEVYIPYPAWYPAAVPYADADNTDNSADQSSAEDSDDDTEYQGGPTIFDRRGSGADSYVPPVDSDSAEQESPVDADTSISAEAPTDPTILVFKDGHQLEVQNYAVISQTLYDLTPGHRRKIALAELNLPETERLNEDRGVIFELPPPAQAD